MVPLEREREREREREGGEVEREMYINKGTCMQDATIIYIKTRVNVAHNREHKIYKLQGTDIKLIVVRLYLG